MSATGPQDDAPARGRPRRPALRKEPEPANLVPCEWLGCRFAFQKNVERPDVILVEDFAAIPLIQDGWCLVPDCKRYFAAIYHHERIDETFIPGGGPKPRPGYRLSTEATSIEEFRKRDEEDDELEARLREAAQKDERVDITQLEVAGTVVTLTQREAALFVHCTEEWAGRKIKTRNDWGVWHRNRQKTVFTLAADVVGRPAGGGIVYAAVFPRIRPVSYIGWHEGVRTATCAISADREEVRYQDSYELSLGNVTEIDWTTPPTPERRPPSHQRSPMSPTTSKP